ncbi:MAG: hypothetical protein ACE5GE_16650 [Phycisphaerae bacterium]
MNPIDLDKLYEATTEDLLGAIDVMLTETAPAPHTHIFYREARCAATLDKRVGWEFSHITGFTTDRACGELPMATLWRLHLVWA